MQRITIDEDVRLDLGHTDLVGTLVFDDKGLAIVSPTGSAQVLGRSQYVLVNGSIHEAAADHILIEEMGLTSTLPDALVRQGYCEEVARHQDLSAWGVDVVELRVLADVAVPV